MNLDAHVQRLHNEAMDASFESDIVLQNKQVLLRPLRVDDVDALLPVALEPTLWEVGVAAIRDRAELEAYVHHALTDRAEKRAYPFVVVHPETKQLVGSTRFYNIALADKRLAIGWTWLAASVRGSGLNLAKKFEMLRFAFENLQMNRVEFNVDAINTRSRRAIQKLGATEEGVLRRHMITYNGRVRDTVVCSILREEWPHLRETVFAQVVPETKVSLP